MVAGICVSILLAGLVRGIDIAYTAKILGRAVFLTMAITVLLASYVQSRSSRGHAT
jgi:hypothetical protein